jgi:hypothetical protein
LKACKLPLFNAEIAGDLEKHTGELFRVKGEISSRRPLTVGVGGRDYSLWSSDKESNALRPLRKLPEGSAVDIIGLLSSHKGKPQFLVEDPAWVIGYKAASKEG